MKAVHVLLILAGIGATATAFAAPVQVKETGITIPTYLLGPQDPNPPFRLINANNVYPYTMLDSVTDEREPKTYKAIVLENEYLRATIIPSLGARLYSLYDKSSKREVFYRNNVVKYALIGLRGAWISGGVEFNFPNGHTTDTVSPVSSRFQKNSDGSASVFLGDVDQVSGMFWQVELTLRPGQRRLEEHVTLFNPTADAGLYWYWDNAAVPATEDLHFMYPMREVNPDSRTEFWNYPVWKGIDYSRSADVPRPSEIFGMNIHRDYFGVYYPKADVGTIHVANYRDEAGKKIWTWGVGSDGKLWTKILTDHDGPYDEIQAGVYQTQLNQDFLPSRRVTSWTEYWYPVDHMQTGFVDATSQFALNASTADGKASVSVESTEPVAGVKLTVKVGGKTIKSLDNLSFEPASTRTFTIPLPGSQSGGALDVTLADKSGRVLLHWDQSAPIDGNTNFVSRVGEHPAKQPSSVSKESRESRESSVQQLYLKGLLAQKEGRQSDALQAFEDVLQRDPGYLPALRSDALLLYRGAQFKQAAEVIGRATQENHADPQSQYIAGIVDKASGDLFAANDAFWAAIRYGGPEAPAYAQLGEIALSQRDYPRAENYFRSSLGHNPHDALTLSALAEALRLQKKDADAEKFAAEAVREMPLYPPALAEQWLVAVAQDRPADAARQAWIEASGGRVENALVAAAWYWSHGDWAASSFILKAAVGHLPAQSLSPMVYFYLASCARHENNAAGAAKYEAQANTAPYEAVFPNRLSDEALLRETVVASPHDALAQYLLGTFLFQYGQYKQADQLWAEAQGGGLQYAVLDRDRGIYAWRVEHNLPQAAAQYRKAVALTPLEHHLYVDLDQIYAQMGATAERQQLFASAPASIFDQDTSRARYILLLMETGHADKALDLLKTHRFHPWELGGNMHAVYVQACIEQGRARLAAGDAKQAQQSFEAAGEYPENLGIGRPEKPEESAQLYWLGKALDAQGDHQGAQAAWNKAIAESGPDSLISFYYASLAEKALGQPEAAKARIAQLEGYVAKSNPHAAIVYYRGMIQQGQGNLPAAEALFRKALVMEPSYWPAEVELAREPAKAANASSKQASGNME